MFSSQPSGGGGSGMHRISVRVDVVLLYTVSIVAVSVMYAGGLDCAFPGRRHQSSCAAPDGTGADDTTVAPFPEENPAPGSAVIAVDKSGRRGSAATPSTDDDGGGGVKRRIVSKPVSADVAAILALEDADVMPGVRFDRKQWSHTSLVKGSTDAQRHIDGLIEALIRDTDAFETQDEFRQTKQFIEASLESARAGVVLNQTRAKTVAEFNRPFERCTDPLYRVPNVRWNNSRLAVVSPRRVGLLLTFYHISPPEKTSVIDRLEPRTNGGLVVLSRPATKTTPALIATSPPEDYTEFVARRRPGIKVAVEMSGHMRTFRACRETTVQKLLATNDALLFITTYPDIGDKRYGVREQLADDPAPTDEIVDSYAPHLAALYLLDLPAVTKQLSKTFPTLFSLKQWSWMIYQLFTMELTNNVTLAYPSLRVRHGRDIVVGRNADDPDGKKLAASWGPGFDVLVRIRPDLYLVTRLKVFVIDDGRMAVAMACDRPIEGKTGEARLPSYFETFNASNEILRSPHHPTIEWFLDPLSDHSAIGGVAAMTKLMSLYSAAAVLKPEWQERFIFPFGQTAERLWGQHAKRNAIELKRTWGWHIMLRDPVKYKNTSFTLGNSQRRAVLIRMVFGVTDGTKVPCPSPDKGMRHMAAKPTPKPKPKPRAKGPVTLAPTTVRPPLAPEDQATGGGVDDGGWATAAVAPASDEMMATQPPDANPW